jgi:hypothetical protein
MSETQTNVQQSQVDDLDNLLGMPGAESVITPNENDTPKPQSFFSNNKPDMAAFDSDSKTPDKEVEPEPKEEGGETEPKVSTTDANFDNIVSEVDPVEPDDNDDPNSKPGRPSLDKGGMAQLAKKLIDDKLLLPFDDDKPMEDYTMDDYKELFEVNFQERERKIREETPQEFFNALPRELQYAAQYVASGGSDLKGLFKHLATSEEMKSLDVSSDRGQEQIVREYLRAKQFGSEEDIQEEIDSWKDLGKLEEKAAKYKPELDKMQEQIVQKQLVEQEAKRKQQENASYAYMESVYDVLEDGELNGIKLNPKVQNMLYAGLVQPNYPSISGKNTNLFGHLIEKYQFVEPRHDLIAEALYLLADPNGYKEHIRQEAKNESAADTARTLKTEQSNKNTVSAEPDNGGGRSRGIPRPNKNFFKR